MAWIVPLVSGAVGAMDSIQQGAEDATLLRNQAATSAQQGYADEAQQRRAAKLFLGKQAAAAAQAGGGYGGTTAGVLSDSHTAAEIDALNIRYRSINRSTGLLAQANAALSGSKRVADGQLLAAAGQAAGKYLEKKDS